jgi:hypothetical protein
MQVKLLKLVLKELKKWVEGIPMRIFWFNKNTHVNEPHHNLAKAKTDLLPGTIYAFEKGSQQIK